MLKVTSAQNPKYATPDNKIIELQVTFAEFGDAILPFGASEDDCHEHGRVLHAKALAGEFGPIAEYVPPPPAENQPTVQGAQTL